MTTKEETKAKLKTLSVMADEYGDGSYEVYEEETDQKEE